ncbi:unnamed protein product [Acidithrix sp. C25]|nr:unnamed protein product [Acidithrix sp. C25]
MVAFARGHRKGTFRGKGLGATSNESQLSAIHIWSIRGGF